MRISFITRQHKSDAAPKLYARIALDSSKTEVVIDGILDKDWKTNNDIRKLQSKAQDRFNEIYNLLVLQDIKPTAELIKQYYRGNTTLIKPVMLSELFDIYVKSQLLPKLNKKKNNSKKTEIGQEHFNKFLLLKNQLRDFMDIFYGIDDIVAKNVTKSFISDFITYLETAPTKKYKTYSHNSMVKHLQKLKSVFQYGIDIKECVTKNPFAGLELKTEETNPVFLTDDEIIRIATKKLGPSLNVIRELFLFQCFTGFSYAEMCALKRYHVNVEEGYIMKPREKSDKPYVVPLFKYTLYLLMKYNFQLPVKSNQKHNEYLKDIGSLCNIPIEKNLTTHVGRHTFATTVSLNNNVDIAIISKMLGHSKLSTTEHYSKFNTKLVLSAAKDLEKAVDQKYTSSLFSEIDNINSSEN